MPLISLMSSQKPHVSIKSQSWDTLVIVAVLVGVVVDVVIVVDAIVIDVFVDGIDVLDVLAKTPCLYLVPELRYWVKYLVEKNITHRHTDEELFINILND